MKKLHPLTIRAKKLRNRYPAWVCCRRCGSRRFKLTRASDYRPAAMCARGHVSVVFYDRLVKAGIVRAT